MLLEHTEKQVRQDSYFRTHLEHMDTLELQSSIGRCCAQVRALCAASADACCAAAMAPGLHRVNVCSAQGMGNPPAVCCCTRQFGSDIRL